MKYFVFALRALATLALAGTAAVAKGAIPVAYAPVFAAVAFLCGLAHAQPLNVKALIDKLFSKTGAAVALFVALSVSVVGCHLPLPPPIAPTPVADGGTDGGFVNCLEAKTHAAVLSILPDVVDALSTGDYAAQLTALTVQFGDAAVYCAVVAVVDELTKIELQSEATGPEPTVESALKNGEAWLAARKDK